MKYLCPILLSCVIQASALHAEEKMAALKVTPFGNLLAEVAVTDKLVMAADVTMNNMSMSLWRDASASFSAASLGVRASWHKRGAFEQGAYASVYLDYIYFAYDGWGNGFNNPKEEGTGTTQAIGFISGYQWLWDDSLSLNLGGGYGFVLPTTIETTSTTISYDRLGYVVNSQSTPSTTDILANSSFILDAYIGFVF